MAIIFQIFEKQRGAAEIHACLYVIINYNATHGTMKQRIQRVQSRKTLYINRKMCVLRQKSSIFLLLFLQSESLHAVAILATFSRLHFSKNANTEL